MKRMALAVAVTALMTTSACATRQGTGALIGGAGGVAAGAGIGAAVGGGQGAAIGGAVGGIVGAGTGAVIGKYMDDQEKKLKELKSAKVERTGDKITVEFNSAILFDVNKAVLKPEAANGLKEFAAVLKEYKETDLIIEGHTDSTGAKDYNKKLSMERAQSVISFLTAQGVEQGRLTAMGYGDEKPAADNATTEGRQANRRVEIQIKANEKLQEADAKAAKPQQS